MVRETSGRAAALVPPPSAAIPLPELGIALHPGVPYRFRIGPVSTPPAGRPAPRLWTLHAYPIERVGVLVRVQPLRRLGHRSDAPPPSMSLIASRFMGAELLTDDAAADPGGTLSRATGYLTLSEGDPKPNARAELGAAAPAAAHERYITGAPGASGPETNHRPDALAEAPAGDGGSVVLSGPADAAIPPGWASVDMRTGSRLEARDRDAGPAPELAAFLLVAHRSVCASPEGCAVSAGYWSELVALYGKARALGAFYTAERIMQTRRAHVNARAMLANARQTQAVPA